MTLRVQSPISSARPEREERQFGKYASERHQSHPVPLELVSHGVTTDVQHFGNAHNRWCVICACPT